MCITRRRRGVHQGGKWELPGGKLEPREPPLAGLKRELHEELGIRVDAAEPFTQVHHVYPHVEVLLDVWRVTSFQGVPHGREAQELRWVDIDTLDPGEFPEADHPVLRRLQLPPLYLLSAVGRFGSDEFTRRLALALRAGARLVQLREPQMDRASFIKCARELGALCHDHGARLLVNADPACVAECAADGVHLSSRRLLALAERPLAPKYWIGASCHNQAELERAWVLGVDFAVLGPVRPTSSHPGGAVLGWEQFGVLCASVQMPIYAIGGMRPGDLPKARAAHAHGLAMISGIWERQDIEAAVDESVQLNRMPG